MGWMRMRMRMRMWMWMRMRMVDADGRWSGVEDSAGNVHAGGIQSGQRAPGCAEASEATASFDANAAAEESIAASCAWLTSRGAKGRWQWQWRRRLRRSARWHA